MTADRRTGMDIEPGNEFTWQSGYDPTTLMFVREAISRSDLDIADLAAAELAAVCGLRVIPAHREGGEWVPIAFERVSPPPAHLDRARMEAVLRGLRDVAPLDANDLGRAAMAIHAAAELLRCMLDSTAAGKKVEAEPASLLDEISEHELAAERGYEGDL